MANTNDTIDDNFDFADNLSDCDINLDSDDDDELECPDEHNFASFNIKHRKASNRIYTTFP